MIDYQTFTGGIFETNCYLFDAPAGPILFDAPDGACDWLVEQGIAPRLLLLTHGHIDHIIDVARIKERFGCPVGIHPESAPMISDPDFFRDYGFQFEIQPVEPDLLIEATLAQKFLGLEFEVLEVPGHCPGSLCFLSHESALLIGGDVLFAGGVGRWDLPGGDSELLFAGIREKLYSLGENITVLPGHGPPTTIGAERRSNPFVR
jgi:hydroxyacylglutathione hydrolase